MGGKPTSEEDRFWSKVDQRGPNECWPWLAAVGHNGYGRFRYTGRHEYAHRVAFRLANNLTPADMPPVVRHTCDNRPCCNPAHLEGGTWRDNTQDAIRRGRFNHGTRGSPGRKNGNAKLTESDVLAIRASDATAEDLARQYETTKTNIYYIRNRRTWKHL